MPIITQLKFIKVEIDRTHPNMNAYCLVKI